MSEFALVRHRGGAGNDVICGNVSADVFDADAGGNDQLHGYGGNDTYWLGQGRTTTRYMNTIAIVEMRVM